MMPNTFVKEDKTTLFSQSKASCLYLENKQLMQEKLWKSKCYIQGSKKAAQYQCTERHKRLRGYSTKP